MEKNIIHSLIDFLKYMESEMSFSVQKFSFEPKDSKIWVINKLESGDGFVLKSQNKEYFYLDFKKDKLILSNLGEKDIVEIKSFDLYSNDLFESLLKDIKDLMNWGLNNE